MDALDRLAAPAADLLARVDTTLARAGAPDGHPVWPLLRRLGALPGEAVGAFTVASAAPLAATGSVLRRLTQAYAQASATMPAVADWHGAGAESFAAQWEALRSHLGEELAGRMHATVSYLEDIEDWTREARAGLARAIASALVSAQAVLLRTAVVPPEGDPSAWLIVPRDLGLAAADIAADVLGALLDAYDAGAALLGEWAPRLGEVPYRAPGGTAPVGLDATTEVTLQ